MFRSLSLAAALALGSCCEVREVDDFHRTNVRYSRSYVSLFAEQFAGYGRYDAEKPPEHNFRRYYSHNENRYIRIVPTSIATQRFLDERNARHANVHEMLWFYHRHPEHFMGRTRICAKATIIPFKSEDTDSPRRFGYPMVSRSLKAHETRYNSPEFVGVRTDCEWFIVVKLNPAE